MPRIAVESGCQCDICTAGAVLYDATCRKWLCSECATGTTHCRKLSGFEPSRPSYLPRSVYRQRMQQQAASEQLLRVKEQRERTRRKQIERERHQKAQATEAEAVEESTAVVVKFGHPDIRE